MSMRIVHVPSLFKIFTIRLLSQNIYASVSWPHYDINTFADRVAAIVTPSEERISTVCFCKRIYSRVSFVFKQNFLSHEFV